MLVKQIRNTSPFKKNLGTACVLLQIMQVNNNNNSLATAYLIVKLGLLRESGGINKTKSIDWYQSISADNLF